MYFGNPLLQLFFKIGGIGAAIYLLLCLVLFLGQKRFIFVPCQEIAMTPDQQGLTYKDVWLPVGDRQEHIHGWWLPNPKTESVLLYFHGNGGNISVNLHRAQLYHSLGFSVFLIDYRGYGQSQGQFPTETQVYQDAQRAWDYLAKEQKIQPSNIFVYGHSLGGAIAINLASYHPDIAGLIIESSFTSIRDMANLSAYRVFPLDLILIHKFDSLSKVKALSMPLLFMHGTEDKIVPSFMSQVLFDAVQNPKKLVFFPGGDHNNLSSTYQQLYLQTIEDFTSNVYEVPIIDN